MLPSVTPAFPCNLSLKPYVTWSDTFSLLFGYTVIQLLLSSCQSRGSAACRVILHQQGLEAAHALFLLVRKYFSLSSQEPEQSCSM